MSSYALVGFERTLVQQNAKIRSTCQKCGCVIVASVSEGLQEREVEHAQRCQQNAELMKKATEAVRIFRKRDVTERSVGDSKQMTPPRRSSK